MRRPRILTGRWRSCLPISRSSALEMERADSGSYEATGHAVTVFQIGNPDPKPARDVTHQDAPERFARDHIDLSAYRADDEEEPDADRGVDHDLPERGAKA